MRGALSIITFNRRGRARSCVAAVSLLAVIISGCTPWAEYKNNGFKVGPNYHRPHADVADHWIDSTDKRLSSDEPDLSQWWTNFNDPQLNDLILYAVHQNLSLKEACFRILEERAALAIAYGNLFPQTQQAVGGYQRGAISTLAANQQFLPERFFDNFDLGFNLAWELDFWGRFRRAIESAQAELNASVFDYDDVLVTLLGDVGATYIQIRTLQQQIEYVKENIIIQNESLEIAQARFQGGLASDLDTQQATSQLAQTEALVPQFEKQLRAANDRMCVLLSIPTEDLMQRLGDKPIPPVVARRCCRYPLRFTDAPPRRSSRRATGRRTKCPNRHRRIRFISSHLHHRHRGFRCPAVYRFIQRSFVAGHNRPRFPMECLQLWATD